MKTLYFLLIALLALGMSSCSNLVYQKTVPEESGMLKEFSKELQGSYIDQNNDTLHIYSHAYQYGQKGSTGEVSGELNSELVLKTFGGYYFLNFKDSDGFWELVGAKLKDDKLTLYFVNIDSNDDVKIINSMIKKGRLKSTRHGGKYVAKPRGEEIIKLFNNRNITDTSILKKIR